MAATVLIDITCPNCQSRYKIKPQALGPKGRTVRCTNCAHRWHVDPPAVEDDGHAHAYEIIEPAPLPEEPATESRGETTAVAARGSGGAIAAWLTLLLVALVVTGLIAGRNEILAIYPQFAEFYTRLGLPVTLDLGLELRRLDARERVVDGDSVLVVTAEIHNVTEDERDVPPVKVTFFDTEQQAVEERLVEAPQERLPPGGMTRVEAEVDLPAEGAASYTVALAPAI